MADAIWNDRYILSNMTSEKLYAKSPLTTGVSGTSAYIGLEPSATYNETVLWSGSTALTAMNGSANAITLSGSLYDYDRVAFYAKPLNGHEALKVVEIIPNSSSEGFDWLTWFKGGGLSGNGAIRMGAAFIQHNASSMWVKTDELFQLSLASGGISMATNQNVLTKVVGINRKEV